MNEGSEIADEIRKSIVQSQSLISKLKLQEEQLISQLSTVVCQTPPRKQKEKPKGRMSQPTVLNNFEDQSKIEKQLEKQLQNSQIKLKQLQYQLKQQSKKKPRGQLQSLNELFEIESQIKQTQMDIKSMTEEVKNLNFLKKKQEKVLINKQSTINYESQKMSKLVDELYLLKSTLQKLKSLSQKKKHDIQSKKQEVKEIEQSYLDICAKNGDKPVTFQDFKHSIKDKLKSISHSDKSAKKQYVSIKQLIKSKQTYEHVQPTKQNLLELRNKKEIAHHALKNAKKKHEVELRQLNKKLSTAKQENSELLIKLQMKEKERREVESASNSKKKGRLTPMSSIN